MDPNFDSVPILSYLSLSLDYVPSPSTAPLDFLAIHLRQLPPNLLRLFSSLLTPTERTVLPIIRNRRQKYTSTIPRELTWSEARKRWPSLWQGRERPGQAQAEDEEEWADSGLGFLGGKKGEVGKLGQLLGQYEEEREAERLRGIRRNTLAPTEDRAEEDEDSENDEMVVPEERENMDETRISFERLVAERFIYGTLDSIDYDPIDWDDKWDEVDERDREEQWFDEEEEADAPVDQDLNL